MTAATFTAAEYEQRLARTQQQMAARGFDHLLVADPANLFYLTGFDAYSFYTPQVLVIPQRGKPLFFCREVDASSAWLTSNLDETQVFGYPERYVQHADRHPMDWVAAALASRLDHRAVLAVESESPYYTLRSHQALTAGLTHVEVTGTMSIVSWVRAVKSPAEIETMRAAAQITQRVFAVARETIRPGVRQCDAVAEIYAAGIRGTQDAGGSYPAIPPLVLAGANTAFPHVAWTDQPFVDDEPIALELAGCRQRYHVPVARTMYLGKPPAELHELADITGEGLDAMLATIRPGVACQDVAAAWSDVIARHGHTKSGRVGYPVGIGYPPDWGEQTMSMRAGDTTVLAQGMTFHMMIGMWLDGRGYSISETILVTDSGTECLTVLPRGLWST